MFNILLFVLAVTCTPNEVTWTPTPVVLWDEVPSLAVTGWRVYWRESGDTAWRGSFIVPYACHECPLFDDQGNIIDTFPFSKGVHFPVPLSRYLDLTPMRVYEFSVRAMNGSVESPADSNIIGICWPPQQRWGF